MKNIDFEHKTMNFAKTTLKGTCKKMEKILKIYFLFIFIFPCLFSRTIIRMGDTPTAYTLPRGYFDFTLRMQKQGGLIIFLNTAIMDYLSIGISYGGMNILGQEEPKFYPLPGIFVRYLAIYEGYIFPALSIGMETQGYDLYIEESERYEVKSKGVYLVLTKTFPLLSGFSLNGGLNYTFERKDERNGLDLFTGAQFSFSPDFSIFSDFTLAYNDPSSNGFLNIGFELSFEEQFFFKFAFRNLLNKIPNRILEIGYRGYL